jgi:hypothetical protein
MNGRCAALLCLVPVAVGGCYSYTRYGFDRPAPGTAVEVTLNDLGRVAMEQRVGAEVLTIEGLVSDVTDSSFVLRAQRVVSLDGSSTVWSNEPITIRLEHVRQVRERRFSVGRTVLLAGTAVGVMTLTFGRSLIGLADASSNGRPGEPPAGQ